jgi:4-hydroxythreonine-4-phosphate dehydrogenase
VSGGPQRKPLALSLGEPAGIGPDIAIDAWLARDSSSVPPFLFVGDAALLKRRAAAMGRDLRIATVAPEEAASVFSRALPCLSGMPAVEGRPGELHAGDAAAVIASIQNAVTLVHSGVAAAVVTNPINKKALNAVGFPFPGHTEFLGAIAQAISGTAVTPVMMLVGPQLRVVPVTVHIPLAAVPGALTTELIVCTGEIVARELRARFGIAAPRLALAGLNPHAGEEGMLGPEDAAVVRPAVDALRAAGIDATGPLPADTMFHEAARSAYDVALCMYHDQALIPIKTLAFDEGVNVTLGLPFVRTSPDHGTALPLAGTGRARATSLVAALRLADRLAGRDLEAVAA